MVKTPIVCFRIVLLDLANKKPHMGLLERIAQVGLSLAASLASSFKYGSFKIHLERFFEFAVTSSC